MFWFGVRMFADDLLKSIIILYVNGKSKVKGKNNEYPYIESEVSQSK